MSNFTDGVARIVRAADLERNWGGGPKGLFFRCYLCGDRFDVGDTYRFQYVEGRSNFFVCAECDGPDVVDRWLALIEEFRSPRFWSFRKELDHSELYA